MNINIRQEEKRDFKAVFELIKEAFKAEQFSDHKEQFLVERLRVSAAFIPSLSIVAEYENKLVGYILLSKIKIKDKEEVFDSLALAPVAVLPKYQAKGIGAMLIKYAHQQAKVLGHQSVILLGHQAYYPRFGYQEAANFGIQLPFDVPKENCMAIELVENGLENVKGMVVYPQAFYE